MNDDRLKTNLSYQFGLVHLNEDWIAPLLKAIEDTTFEEARFQPAPGVASVWEIVLHATGWMEDLLHDRSPVAEKPFGKLGTINTHLTSPWVDPGGLSGRQNHCSTT